MKAFRPPGRGVVAERSVPINSFVYEAALLSMCSLWIIFAAHSVFAFFWHPDYAFRWAAASELIFFSKMGFVFYLRCHWKSNAGEMVPARLHFQDYVTIARGFAISCMGGFIFIPKPPEILAWVPCFLYLIGIAGDFLDGYLARKLTGPTRFGAILDLEFDSAATLLAVLLAVLSDRLPPWYVAVGLARYLFSTGVWWRRKKGLTVDQLPASICRRLIGGANSLFLAAAISPTLPGATARLLSLPFMLLISGSFISDWYMITRDPGSSKDKNSRHVRGVNRFKS